MLLCYDYKSFGQNYLKKVIGLECMKHTYSVTFTVLAIFFIAQIIGLGIISSYIDHPTLEETGKITYQSLPLNFERPEIEEQTSFIYIIAAVIIGTILALLLIRFKQRLLWKFWFLVAVFITLTVAFKPFITETYAIVVAAILALWKIYKPNFYVHNFTEFFIYGGLAAIFVPVLNIFAAIMLLIFISIYDAYAVWKSKHMIKLAKFQSKTNMFAGIIIPYKLPALIKTKKTKLKKVKTAILGGGDIGFPLLFAGVVFKELLLINPLGLAFAKALIIPIFTALALGWLLFKAEKNKFYPAMPAISAGAFLGFVVMNLIGFL